MKLLDEYLAKAIESGRNLVALSCSIKLINAIVSAEKRETPITDKDLLKTKDTLYRLAANVKLLPDSSAQLLEPFRLNPEAYNPLRFHPNNTDQRHPYAYIPFSAGGHNCIGQNFAFKEERLVISSLVSRFHISLDEEKGRIQQRRYWLSQNPL